MKRLEVFSLIGMMVILLAWIATPISAGASPGLVVVPSEHDFGEVELNSSVSTGVTVTNDWYGTLLLNNIYMTSGNSLDFTYALPPLFNGEISPNTSIEIQVTYSPSALGTAAAVLVIDWLNGEAGQDSVNLEGVGVEASGEPVTIAKILDFFDASVADGKLFGCGPGKSADGRLKALRNMIEAAGDLIAAGDYEVACQQLQDAYDRCDGEFPPPDFVEGDAADDLATMILELMADLVC